MSAHTLGPWMLKKEHGNRFVVDVRGNHVCTISRWTPQVDNADARLIAAAPELLRTLQQLVRCLQADAAQNPTRNSIGPCAQMFLDDPALAQALAAISGATGDPC